MNLKTLVIAVLTTVLLVEVALITIYFLREQLVQQIEITALWLVTAISAIIVKRDRSWDWPDSSGH